MRHQKTTALRRFAALGAPAAVLGTLAGSLVPATAHAEPASLPAQVTFAPQSRATAVTPAPASNRPTVYTVKRGDTISAIAARFGLPVADVLRWNGLGWRSIIRPGQQVRLSVPGTASPAATPSTSAAADTHTVVRGDTVYAIAKRHGTSVATIFAANGLGPSSIIYPGQKLLLRAPAPATATLPQRSATLNAPQAENTRMIIAIGRELGVPDRGIAIALAAAMVESGIRNLPYGDRDSVGLFQQRPSTGWGSSAQIQQRAYAIRAFYGGPANPNRGVTRGLLDISGWQQMPFTQAAQAVQISAFPDRYGQWETAAYQWLARHGCGTPDYRLPRGAPHR